MTNYFYGTKCMYLHKYLFIYLNICTPGLARSELIKGQSKYSTFRFKVFFFCTGVLGFYRCFIFGFHEFPL